MQKPWVFLIYHGISTEEITALYKIVAERVQLKLTPHNFFGAPHNTPPGESATSWFVAHIEKLTRERDCKPAAIVWADPIDHNYLRNQYGPDYVHNDAGIRQHAQHLRIPYLLIKREELQ